MDIMIAGAGTVGYNLAQNFSHKHNVIVVDKELDTLDRLEEHIDIMTLLGDVEDPQTYASLQIKEMDLFIAVTDSDEANLLSTLIIDDSIAVRKKIIRLKNDYFLDSKVLDKLNIQHAIFPDIDTAEKVASLFTFPKANNVKSFSQCREKMISIKVQCPEPALYTVAVLNESNVKVLGIEREKVFFIPGEEETVQSDDLLYLFGRSQSIEKLSAGLNVKMPSVIRKVAIFGANPLAQKIAKKLAEKELEIKMIDKNKAFCQMASETLHGKVTVIHTVYEEHTLFEAEGLKNADMIIAAGMNDEKNIVKCIEAKEYGIEKVVAINNDSAYYNLMHQLGIVVVRGSKMGAYYTILENISSSAIVTERHFCGGQAVLFMRKVYEDSALIGKKISGRQPDNVLILILREMQLYRLDEAESLQTGDMLLVSSNTQEEESVHKWIYTL